MKQDINIAVLGGDARQIFAAERLAQCGYTVTTWGLCGSAEGGLACESPQEALREANVWLLPIPLSRDHLQLNGTSMSMSVLISMLRDGLTVFCGMPSDRFREACDECGAKIVDYSQDEIFLLQNAMPTAEGAVAIAMNEMRRTLFGSDALIVGYGRIGKLLADLLVRMGVHVTVAARKARDIATAELHGCRGLLLENDSAEQYCLPILKQNYHVIWNTVPSPVIGREVLKGLSRSTVLIDLASAPGGIDYDAANSFGLKTVIALSLPGKVAPITAGEIIGNCVIRQFEGGGDGI